MNTRKAIFILLALIWFSLIIYNTRGGGVKGVSNRGRVTKSASIDIPRLRLDLLEKSPPPYTGIKKDIFSPIKISIPQFIAVEAIKLPPPTPLEIFLRTVRFLGFIEKEQGKTVFLSRGNDLFTARYGDIIDERFRIEEITLTQMKFKDVINQEEATIELIK